MMKNLVISAFMAFICLALVVPEAEAARFGGGRSFGMRRAAPPMRAPASAGKPAPGSAAAANPAGAGRFLGPLAGLAAGIGLMALFSHFGIGEGMANILLIMALVMGAVFVMRWLARKSAPPADMRYAQAGQANFNQAPAQFEASNIGAGGTATGAVTAANIPADFDVDGFLRQAKVSFVRLQAANDRGDMDDIREFTTPEVFAEVQLEYKERGGRTQETDVMHLDAELLEVVSEENRHIVSVNFTGQIRENANAEPAAFSEIWHLTKPTDDSRGWSVAGIQQA